MKKLVLLGLAILISMSVVAAASVSTMYFSGVDIEGSVETKSRTGFYVWGVVNRAPLAEVTIKTEKTITSETAGPVCVIYNDENSCTNAGCTWDTSVSKCVKPKIIQSVTLAAVTYHANGWIKFDKINVGQTTRVKDFDMDLTLLDHNPAQSPADFLIYNRNLDTPNFYVTRVSSNQYKVFCNGVSLRTKATLPYPYYFVAQEMPWIFEATIQV